MDALHALGANQKDGDQQQQEEAKVGHDFWIIGFGLLLCDCVPRTQLCQRMSIVVAFIPGAVALWVAFLL